MARSQLPRGRGEGQKAKHWRKSGPVPSPHPWFLWSKFKFWGRA